MQIKSKITLLQFILLLSGTAFAQTRQDYEAAATNFQTFYNKKQPADIYKMFAPRVTNVMTPEKTKEMVTNMHRDLGDIKAHTYIKQDDQFTFYKMDYTKGQLILVVCLNSENKFQNFRFIAYDSNYEKLR